MKKLYECNAEYAKRKLWNIRQDVILCSLYYKDYNNRYGYNPYTMCDFFDGYAEYLDELMQETVKGYTDAMFFDRLNEYDTPENLYDWYCCLERPEF